MRDQLDITDGTEEIRAINAHLLIAALREQEMAEQLRLQLAFRSAITTSLGEGVCAFDQAGRISYMNPAAEQMLGLLEADLLGKDMSALLQHQIVGKATPTFEPAPLLELMRTGVPYRHDHALLTHSNGYTYPITYTIAPMVCDQVVVGAVVVVRDLSELRKLEALREEYLALLSHDLRTPLTAIMGFAQQLLRKLTRQGLEKEAASAQVILKNARRMERMLRRIIERSVLEAGAAPVQHAPLDLVHLVRQMVEQLPIQVDRERIQMEMIDELPMRGDETQLERVIVNLITNALQYSDSASRVVVQLSRVGQQARMSVRDQGPGIHPQELPHLFEKHYRASSAGSVNGSGLGLYSSQLIVSAHGGQMWVESELGIGSTFVVAFPLGQESAH
jgi:PAS domain S-box-containing protein